MAARAHRPGLEVEQVGAVTVARIVRSDLLSEQTITAVGSQLAELVDQWDCRQLVLDFSRVKRLSSAMLSKIIGLHKKIKGLGGRLVLCQIDPMVAEIFTTLALDRLFPSYGTEQEALQSFE